MQNVAMALRTSLAVTSIFADISSVRKISGVFVDINLVIITVIPFKFESDQN